MSIGVPKHERAGGRAPAPRLLADVGGTNARFALEFEPGQWRHIKVYPCADYAGLAEVIQAYLRDAADALDGARLAHAAVAIATPIDGDEVAMTNHNWRFSIEQARTTLGLDTLLVINDFTALAMAVPRLDERQRMQVGGGKARPGSAIGVLGPGTGLGASGLVPSGERWIPLDSEGGHANFAPADARELAVLQFAWQAHAHVSFERLVSGPGIVLVYQALAAWHGREAEPLETADIVRRALAGQCDLCMEVVECFCGMLGTFAGNVAITLGARGGVYIGGGVVPHLGDYFARSPFRARFEAKGRFTDYLAQVPTFVITDPYPAFLGVSAILADHLRSGTPGGALVERVQHMHGKLSPAERRVADLVINHPRTLIGDPVGEIARKANVSQPTVIRFCRSLGCQGLTDFKLKLAGELIGSLPVGQSRVRLGDAASDFGGKVLDNTMSAILQMREHLNFDALEQAIDRLHRAHRIEFYGLGNSGIVAQDAHYKFFRFGIPTIAYHDPYLQAASAALLRQGDVVVMVSNSGKSEELLRLADQVLRAGASVIALTTRGTPLAKKASVALETDHLEMRDSHLSMISRILHLLMIDILAVGVAIRKASPVLDAAAQGEDGRSGALANAARDAADAVLEWLSHGTASGEAMPHVASESS
ncbi:MAG: bifunctional transcriptional regulator/glucokinase [Burkholderiales bacterium]|nr:bifunctional transcriptional regulator/glucokinase [Burkholderiales bacterium]MDE2610636.1 bifunctional transcriptional regulator/glucokinase [Burkholderiales bacterium]